jgi:hypothetical protein
MKITKIPYLIEKPAVKFIIEKTDFNKENSNNKEKYKIYKCFIYIL